MTSAPIVPLRYLAKLDPGKSEVKHLPDDLEVDFIPMDAVGHGGLLHPVETRRLGDVRDGYTYLRSGDVAFAKISPSFQNRKGGRAVALTNDLAFATTELTVLRPEPTADARFLQFVVESEPFIQHGAATLHGVAGQQRVDLSRIAAYPVWLPRVQVQRRIADMLDTETARIDRLIKKNDQVVGLLTARAARVLEDEIFSANARPVGIHYLATYVNGFPFKPEDRSDEGTPIVRIAQLLGDTREQDFYAGTPNAYCHIDSGDLIFSWSATLAAKIWEGGPAFLNQHLFKVEPHEHVDRDWLLHALNATVPRMKALTHGSTMTHITRPMMTKIRVPKPSLPEQRIIAERIAVRFAQVDALRAKIDRQQELLRLRRQSLITAAVTGQIDV